MRWSDDQANKSAADHGRIAKLDRDDAPKPPEKVDAAVGKALAQARADKKNADGKSMTQKELATAVNAQPKDVSFFRPDTTSRADDRLPILSLERLFPTSNCWARSRGLSVSN